ncbi:MAG: D-aminoacyl-tRNA deacylase [Nanoarchaeota archaeon]|nr:D-aminoacyl-tRNA deacylase [Nanoarchaeota archaeon]
MRIAVVVSSKDPAGMNIKKHLLEHAHTSEGMFEGEAVYRFPKFSLYTVPNFCIYAEHLDKKINADLIIFATTHKSKENVPALTCHCVGNWDEAKIGGRAKILGYAPAELLKNAYLSLKKHAVAGYETTIEATHHGPELDIPCIFMEIGSTEKGWNDAAAGKAMASAILETIHTDLPPQRVAFALGGPHYGNSFMKIMERSDVAIGHLCPKHMLSFVDEPMLKQAIEKTLGCKLVVLDWKGLGQEKERLKLLLEELKIEFLRTDKF